MLGSPPRVERQPAILSHPAGEPHMMPVAGWRIWYADGAILDSRALLWENLPEFGVVSIAVFFDAFTQGGSRYRRILDGGDWYWPFHKSGTSSKRGVWIPPPGGVPRNLLKRGVWVSDIRFDIISQKAWNSRWQ